MFDDQVTFKFLYLIFLTPEAIGEVDDSLFGSVYLIGWMTWAPAEAG